MSLRLSAVVPTLNEADSLPETVRRLRAVPQIIEVIVADGGSTDRTSDIAATAGCKVVKSERGRGPQLRAGAMHATGDVIVFVHADTWIPENAGNAIANVLEDPQVVGGGLWKVFRNPHWLMRGSRLRCAIRYHFFRRFMADQAIFVRRNVLEQIGGVPDVPLMEEFELCRLLKTKGTLALADATVETSARRFLERGVIRTYWRMFCVTTRYFLGTPPAELVKLYERR